VGAGWGPAGSGRGRRRRLQAPQGGVAGAGGGGADREGRVPCGNARPPWGLVPLPSARKHAPGGCRGTGRPRRESAGGRGGAPFPSRAQKGSETSRDCPRVGRRPPAGWGQVQGGCYLNRCGGCALLQPGRAGPRCQRRCLVEVFTGPVPEPTAAHFVMVHQELRAGIPQRRRRRLHTHGWESAQEISSTRERRAWGFRPAGPALLAPAAPLPPHRLSMQPLTAGFGACGAEKHMFHAGLVGRARGEGW
jgi:hypothetical protein